MNTWPSCSSLSFNRKHGTSGFPQLLVGIARALEVQAEFHFRSAVMMGPLVDRDLPWELWLLVGELWRKLTRFLLETQYLLYPCTCFRFSFCLSHSTGGLMLAVMLCGELSLWCFRFPRSTLVHSSTLTAFLPKSSPWPEFSLPVNDIIQSFKQEAKPMIYAIHSSPSNFLFEIRPFLLFPSLCFAEVWATQRVLTFQCPLGAGSTLCPPVCTDLSEVLPGVIFQFTLFHSYSLPQSTQKHLRQWKRGENWKRWHSGTPASYFILVWLKIQFYWPQAI